VACASCHGDAGEGKGHAPALAAIANMFKGITPKDEKGNIPSSPMLGMVMLATRSGEIRMPTFSEAKLSDAQLADLAAYIWTLPPPPAPPATPAPREGNAGGR
jgi:cytochrome c553